MRHIRNLVLLAGAVVGFLWGGGAIAADSAPTRARTTIFPYEGEPNAVGVTDDKIVIDYQASRCEFDRASGKMLARKTRAEGYTPMSNADVYSRKKNRLDGPGVVIPFSTKDTSGVADRIEFNGWTWRSIHQSDIFNSRTMNNIKTAREKWGTWTAILNAINAKSFVESVDAEGKRRIYTTADGLASNIVSRFAVANGTLWAACVDIYDPASNEWGPGGLCWYDPENDRWEPVNKINGWPVRWVTLLQTVEDELWVGFRDGSGVDGDWIDYGMGVYPGIYQPATKSIVLARLKDGKWTCFSRPPLVDPKPRWAKDEDSHTTPTERLVKLIRRGNEAIVLSKRKIKPMWGNWMSDLDGQISRLDLASGDWRIFEFGKDIGADNVTDIIEKNGEIIAVTNLGASRWRPDSQAWQFLDPQSPMKNPNIGALASVGDEVWVGYQNQWGITGEQGLSRFNERTGQWSWMSPETLGTASPILNIAALPDGNAWVLFRNRIIISSTEQPRIYPPKHAKPEQSGIGRYFKNKWEFPVALEGVTTSTLNTVKMTGGGTHTYTQSLPIEQMIGADGKLFLMNATGVYMGPNPWRAIHIVKPDDSGRYRDGPFGAGMIIEPAENGNAVLITDLGRQQTEYLNGKYPQALYHPGDSKVSFKPGKLEDEVHQCIERGTTKREGELSLETPTARWTARYGELVREAK